jgi:putative ABC transport system permease protein
MFWRILGQLFSASRGRLAVALLALASGAAVTTALINLNLDAERKVSGEFCTLGANAIILPNPSRDAMLASLKSYELINGEQINDDVPSSPLMSWKVITNLQAYSKDNQIVWNPYLYVVANVVTGDSQQQIILAGTVPDRAAKLAPWWKVTKDPAANRDDFWDCLIGVNVARQLKLGLGSVINLRYPHGSSDSTATLRVTGIVDSGGQEDNQIIATIDFVMKFAGQPGRVGFVTVLIPGTSGEVADGIKRLSAAMPGLDVRPVPQIAQAEASLLPRIRGLIFFMVALILVLTTLCVFASMAALAIERRRDVGLMKAIGGSISRIVRIFFTEAAALGLAGALIGYVAGIFLSRWIGERAFHVAISARPEVLPIVVALMVVVSLAGALPLRLLGRVRPAEILRGE